ncbi:MAG: DUF2975 domain-containing protein [Novosphingobium sp.]|nr:DUF2975 domain-containing protein [Novosphingobium sp.]
MAAKPKDPLLMIAKGIVWFLLGIVAFAGIIVAISAPGVLLFGGEFAGAHEGMALTMNMRLLIAGLLAGVALALFLAWRFFLHLLRIVRSVGEGDPFVPANADRLTAMAWLMLAINVIGLPLAALGAWIAATVGEEPGTADVGVDFGGLLLILTLFILARVFRHGTQLREDLEGTV